MKTTITIDPGTKSGVALWDGQRLANARDLPHHAVREWVLEQQAHQVVIEDQRIYPGSRVSPTSILRLAKLAQACVSGLGATTEVLWWGRELWGGSAPKHILHTRAEALLHPYEAGLWTRAGGDCRDAIAIGLVVVGRATRGLQEVYHAD